MTLPADYRTLNGVLKMGGWAGYPPLVFDCGDASDGDAVISTDTYLASVLNGPCVVKQYNNLTIDTGCILSVTNPCQGLVLQVKDTLTLNGTIDMSGLGATKNTSFDLKMNRIPPTSIWQMNDMFYRDLFSQVMPSRLTFSVPTIGASGNVGGAKREGPCTTTVAGNPGSDGLAGSNGQTGGGGGGGSGAAWGHSGKGGDGAPGNAGGGGGGGGGSGGAYPCVTSEAGEDADGCDSGNGSIGQGTYGNGAKGGRGGGIVAIIAKTITGVGGAIYANGEDGSDGAFPAAAGGSGAGGGGGSVFVLYREKLLEIIITAYGGLGGIMVGGYGAAGGKGGAGSIREHQVAFL